MYLVAVHHVSETGQCMNPDVHVLVLDSSHGELQRRHQVIAFGGELHIHICTHKGKLLNIKICV